MRQLSFFQSVQRHLAACPHKTVLLLMRLIKSEASLLVDQSAQLKARTVLKAQIEVLLAYVEGYALHRQLRRSARKGNGSAGTGGRSGAPAAVPPLKILLDSLLLQHTEALALHAVAFLAVSSRVLDYLEGTEEIAKITKKTLTSKRTAKLHLEHFLAAVLSLKRRSWKEERYIEQSIKQ
jgi:hypothetical protein